MNKNSNQMSQNGKKYAVLNFDQVTELGLKELTTAIGKSGIPVVEVNASNRATKKDNITVKTADLMMEDGQKLTIQINDSGDLSGVKLNSKVLAFQHSNSIADLGLQLSKAVEGNSQKFQDSIARAAKRALKTSDQKPAVKSTAQRLQEAQDRNKTAKSNVQAAQKSLSTYQATSNTLQTTLEKQKRRLTSAQSQEADLQQQIAAIGGSK